MIKFLESYLKLYKIADSEEVEMYILEKKNL